MADEQIQIAGAGEEQPGGLTQPEVELGALDASSDLLDLGDGGFEDN